MVAVDAQLRADSGAGLLPGEVQAELDRIRSGKSPGSGAGTDWVRAPMTISGKQVGSLVAHLQPRARPDAADISVLGILANLAAVSLHTSQEFHYSQVLHRKANQQYSEAAARGRELAERNAELSQAKERLTLAQQRELLDNERHRIARELHDSVTQVVLSAGMSLELARGQLAQQDHPGPAGDALGSLSTAKDLCGQAVEQLRRAIYALHQPHHDTVASLPGLLNEVAEHHRSQLTIRLRVYGTEIPLPASANHEIARAVGEALFNVSAHAHADTAAIRIRYRPTEITVSVSDDGSGRAEDLQRALTRSRAAGTCDGRHRGLVNIETRLGELGGSLCVAQSRLGGPQLEMRLPLPLTSPAGPGLIAGLVGDHRHAPVVGYPEAH